MINSTNYLAQVNEDLCKGCGTCVEYCSVDAVELDENNIARIKSEFCIGCGVCAHFCPEDAISLLEGMRRVFVPPPRLRN
jgi:heterodisulfide reductase subunit A-like polyferredoxin